MKRLALFDLDNTLIPIDSDHAWASFMVKQGMISRERFEKENARFYEDYKAGCLDINAYLNVALEPLSRYSRSDLNHFHSLFMSEIIFPIILPQSLELVEKHRMRGDLCCVVTATNVFITRPIVEAFGIENLIAIELATKDDTPKGNYTGRVKGIPSFQIGKIIRTEAWLSSLGLKWEDFEESFFYSDSHNDIPLMNKVNNPIPTNPDERLREYATRFGWPILELFERKSTK